MTNKNDKKLPVAPTINKLEIGESATFPVERMTTVRATATQRALIMGRAYSCLLNEERTAITVTRTA